MAKDYSLLNCPSQRQDDRLPLWKPKDLKVEAKASVISDAPAPAGSCEFIRGLVDATLDARKCVDSTFVLNAFFLILKFLRGLPTKTLVPS